MILLYRPQERTLAEAKTQARSEGSLDWIRAGNTMSSERSISKRRSGMGLVALACLFVAAAGTLLLQSYLRSSDINQTQSFVFDIRSAAIAWQVDHGDSVCPNMKQLIGGKYLTSHSRIVDAWDQPFTITCFELTVGVSSSGPDRTKGTSDDIVAAPAPARLNRT